MGSSTDLFVLLWYTHRPLCEEDRNWKKKNRRDYGFENIEACVQVLWTSMGCKDLLNRASGCSKYTWIKVGQRNNNLFQLGGGLTLAGGQVPTKATLSPLSSTGQGRENRMKSSWVEIRTGRDHSPVIVTGKTDSTWGN